MSIRIGNDIIANNYQLDKIPEATMEEAGVIRIATEDEVKAGLSNSLAITPYQLANAATKTQVDEETITKDINDVITAIGLKSKNDVLMYNWIGTLAEYERDIKLAIIQPDWVCYVTDDCLEGESAGGSGTSNCIQIHTELNDINEEEIVILERDTSIYRYNVNKNSTFIFDTSSLDLKDTETYTFEIKLHLSGAYSLSFPVNINWMEDIAPTMVNKGVYYLVFRTDDKGNSWYGNSQGRWNTIV